MEFDGAAARDQVKVGTKDNKVVVEMAVSDDTVVIESYKIKVPNTSHARPVGAIR